MDFLIIYDTDHFITISAENIKDCIIQLADYVGSDSPLFNRALKGCDTPESYVYMFNHFSNYQINAIYQISKTIYDER